MRFSKMLVLGLLVTVACGCDSTCENAQEKLDECDDEISREIDIDKGTSSRVSVYLALPIGVSDECNELDECVSDCVNAAECPAIAYVMVHGGVQMDPNAVPPSGTAEFSACINDCIVQAE
jgi:hypothetical protein